MNAIAATSSRPLVWPNGATMEPGPCGVRLPAEHPAAGGDGRATATIYGYRRQLYFTLKFQQLTGPVMAKGLEDTACYVYSAFRVSE